MRFVEPIVGQWYLSRHTQRMFEVISVDELSGAVELQDYEGALDEVDGEEWLALAVEAIEPPEDLAGAFDVVDIDDDAEDRDDRLADRNALGLHAVWRTEMVPQGW